MHLHNPLGQWQSRTTMFLALLASAFGPSDFWLFPERVAHFGGGPFVLLYAAMVLLLVAPVLIAELAVGRLGRGAPFFALRTAAQDSRIERGWPLVSIPLALGAVVALSGLTLVAGWTSAYAVIMARDGLAVAPWADVVAQFQGLLTDPGRGGRWSGAFLLVVAAFSAAGLQRGVGLLLWLTIPAFLALMLVLVGYAATVGDLSAAEAALFAWKPRALTPAAVPEALLLAIYSLGPGLAVAMTLGSYAPARMPLGRVVLAVAMADAVVGMAAGLVLYPLLGVANVTFEPGPRALFVAVPYVFANFSEGATAGTLFYGALLALFLACAAVLLEPVVATVRQSAGVGRRTAVVISAGVTFALVHALLQAIAAESLPSWQLWLGRGLADVLVPLGCLAVAVFAGWRLRPEALREQLYREAQPLFAVWLFLLRFVCSPVIVILLFWTMMPA